MRYKFSLILMFAFVTGFAQQHQLDSLTDFIKNYRKEDTIRVNALNLLSQQYQWIDFYPSLANADSALALARKLNYMKGIATANNLKGFCYWALGDNDQAIKMGLESSVLAENENSQTLLAESFLILGRAYLDQNETNKAKSYIRRAKSIALKSHNWDQLSRAENLQGIILFLAKERDSALTAYKTALQIAQEHGIAKINYPRIISNIGECYIATNPTLAFANFNEALKLSQETGNRTAEASISGILGQAFLKDGNLTQAEQYLQSSLQLARRLGLRRTIRHSYSGLVDLRLKQGRANEAVAYLRRYYEVRDSLVNSSKTRQIVELEARHEIEKKEQAIKLLEQEKELESLWVNVLIGILVLAVAHSILLVYLQKYREQKNREILNLEIDYLTRQHKEVLDKYKSSLITGDEKTLESQDQRLLKKAISVVEDNLSDRLFSVEKMAKEMGMSRTNMHRKISSITGFSPSELIRTIRLRKAATLLINQVDSVSQISLAVGFEDHSYFSKAFKKQFGVPPSEYAQSTTLQQEVVK